MFSHHISFALCSPSVRRAGGPALRIPCWTYHRPCDTARGVHACAQGEEVDRFCNKLRSNALAKRFRDPAKATPVAVRSSRWIWQPCNIGGASEGL